MPEREMIDKSLAIIAFKCGCTIEVTELTYGFQILCHKHKNSNVQKILSSARLCFK